MTPITYAAYNAVYVLKSRKALSTHRQHTAKAMAAAVGHGTADTPAYHAAVDALVVAGQKRFAAYIPPNAVATAVRSAAFLTRGVGRSTAGFLGTVAYIAIGRFLSPNARDRLAVGVEASCLAGASSDFRRAMSGNLAGYKAKFHYQAQKSEMLAANDAAKTMRQAGIDYPGGGLALYLAFTAFK